VVLLTDVVVLLTLVVVEVALVVVLLMDVVVEVTVVVVVVSVDVELVLDVVLVLELVLVLVVEDVEVVVVVLVVVLVDVDVDVEELVLVLVLVDVLVLVCVTRDSGTIANVSADSNDSKSGVPWSYRNVISIVRPCAICTLSAVTSKRMLFPSRHFAEMGPNRSAISENFAFTAAAGSKGTFEFTSQVST